MSQATLYSAPDEEYSKHIFKCSETFESIWPIFYPTIVRIFDTSLEQETLKDCFLKMVLYHDLGKLTERWQENLRKRKGLPSHASLGACYLWKILPHGIKEPISFAVAIHHTDRGLLGDNIEKPDVQAILDGVVNNEGSVEWDSPTYDLGNEFFPQEARTMNVNDLKEMARGLRIWARGCGLLEQHQRRLQAALAHHILKLCDISAATGRKDYPKKGDTDYYGGWLMVENIKNYIENLMRREG